MSIKSQRQRKKARLESVIEILSLVVIICISLILVSLLYSGPFVFFDDTLYITYAHQMLSGTFNPLNGLPFSIQFIMIGFVALSMAIFGTTVIAVEIPSIISLVMLIILTYLIGKNIGGRALGFMSSAFVAVSPITVSYATRVLPDLMVSMFAAFVIYLIIITRHSRNYKAYSFIAGFLAPLLVAIKDESAIFIFLIIIFVVIYSIHASRQKRKTDVYKIDIKFAAVGFLIGIILLFSVFFAYSGNAFNWISQYSKVSSSMAPSNLSQNINFLMQFLNPYTFSSGIKGTLMSAYICPIGLLLDLAIVGSVIFIAYRKWNMLIFSFVNIGVLLFLFFGFKSFNPFALITPMPRFMTIILPEMSIASAYVVIALHKIIGKHSKVAAICVLLVIIVYLFIANIPLYFVNYRYNFSSAFQLHTSESIVLYASQFKNSTIFCAGNGAISLECSYMQFLSHYSNSIFFQTPNTCTAKKISPETFAVFYGNVGGNSPQINKWLAGNCTAQQIFNESEKSSSLYITFYRIEPR